MPEIQPPQSELTEEQQREAEKALTALTAMQSRIDKLAGCGYDCRHLEAYRRALADRFQSLLTAYGRERRRT